MQKQFIQRPDGPWKLVQHKDAAHYSAEAVLEVTIAVGKKAHQPAEIRLTDEDLERLMDVKEIRDLFRRRLLGEVPHREQVLAEEDQALFQEKILARIQRLFEISPEAFMAALELPAVQASIEAWKESPAV